MKRSEFLNKPIPFANWIRNIIRSKFFSLPGLLPLFYLVFTFVFSQFLWFPLGILIFLILSFILIPLENLFGYMNKIDDSAVLQMLYSNLLRLMVIIPMVTISFGIVKKIDSVSKKKIPLYYLRLIVAFSTLCSFFYYLYLIRDWWFLN